MSIKLVQTLLICFIIASCAPNENNSKIDKSKHDGLLRFDTNSAYQIYYSEGHLEEVKKQAIYIEEAYEFLSELLYKKTDFAVLVISEKDWEINAYSPVPGMPEYYKGNLIVGAGQNAMADGYAQMLHNFPSEVTEHLFNIYTDASGNLDMKLFFDKLAIHELTHSFQDPQNAEGYSVSRWLEEVHANMGLYAFYKSKRPNELKYIMTLANFGAQNPPAELPFSSLEEFDANYFKMTPDVYGFYQMRFTTLAKNVIDSLGNESLKRINDFILKYDESYKDQFTPEIL